MNIQDLEYCNFGDYSSIKKILEIVYHIPDFSPIKEAYDTFKSDFLKDRNDKQLKPQKIERNNFKPITNDGDNFYYYFLNEKYTIGVDLPVLVRNKNSLSGECAFIVSEDPLRNSESNKILLSTPFGTHAPFHREKKNKGKLYWDFTLWLFSQNFSSVYFTDIKKLWLKSNSDSSKHTLPKDLNDKFQLCLSEEIDQFNPSVIITFGNEAKRSIPDNFRGQVITYLHPSPTAHSRRNWIDKYKLPDSRHETRLSHMRKIFYEQYKNQNSNATPQITCHS